MLIEGGVWFDASRWEQGGAVWPTRQMLRAAMANARGWGRYGDAMAKCPCPAAEHASQSSTEHIIRQTGRETHAQQAPEKNSCQESQRVVWPVTYL